MKMKEFGPRGGARPWRPPGSANEKVIKTDLPLNIWSHKSYCLPR